VLDYNALKFGLHQLEKLMVLVSLNGRQIMYGSVMSFNNVCPLIPFSWRKQQLGFYQLKLTLFGLGVILSMLRWYSIEISWVAFWWH